MSLARGSTILFLALACLTLPASVRAQTTDYDVLLRRTSFGIPHVKADDWGSLGYGVGYAFAQDNFCPLARDILEANGQLSRYFGPGGGNLESDLFRVYWTSDDVVTRFRDAQGPKFQDLVRGYAAGVNRYLADTGVAALPEDCRDAEWVRPIDELDLYRIYHKLLGQGGAGVFLDGIVEAEPPPAVVQATPAPAARLAAAKRPNLAAVAAEFPAEADKLRRQLEWNPADIGSNMVAVGKDGTKNGKGLLLVNPHFPWLGNLRFYQMHVTIPGKLDSMGAALFGSPVPNIAFNKDVAWSHTVSAARRFTLHQLSLAMDDPTVYLVDGERRDMTATIVSVEVLEGEEIETVEHTFYESEYGPILNISLLTWSEGFAIALQDVNRENFRIFEQFRRMNQAKSTKDLARSLKEVVGLPWVNTAAADRKGVAWYGDVGAIPNLPDEKLEECAVAATDFVLGLGAFLIDGSRSECQLDTDPDAPAPRIFGASNLPSLKRKDYVQNSNDSYWLANPKKPLEGFDLILGGEGNQQGLRTRLGIIQARERLKGKDGLGDKGFTQKRLQQILYGNRNLSAELMLDGLLTLCDEEPNVVDLDEEMVDVGPACTALAGWDRTQNLDSVGAAVWNEFWRKANDIGDLYAVPFDIDDPVNTPRDFNLADEGVRSEAMDALAEGVQELDDLGIAVDATWGSAHFDTRDGETIPIHGGNGSHGIYNAIGTRREDGVGYTPVTSGSSIVQVVTWGKNGPKAQGVLTYSQSTDPESPHFSDQTQLFSDYGWNRLPFSNKEIKADLISKDRLTETVDVP